MLLRDMLQMIRYATLLLLLPIRHDTPLLLPLMPPRYAAMPYASLIRVTRLFVAAYADFRCRYITPLLPCFADAPPAAAAIAMKMPLDAASRQAFFAYCRHAADAALFFM